MLQKTPALDPAACYAAFKAHDTRFDGRFFVGISSTGIYCRPICRVKMPKAENCTFYPSAAAAEAAGYRPCLRCRPELAPGSSPMDALSRLARQAALFMEEGGQDGGPNVSLAALAGRLGISARHLRRVFAAEYGVSPVQHLQTRKLLLAKSLLTDSALSVTDVAMAAGFGSIRRFNDLFKSKYKLSPRDLRKHSNGEQPDNAEGVTLLLGYRPPYDWEALLGFLASRTIPGVECVEGGRYLRTVAVNSGAETLRGWLGAANLPGKNALAITIAPQLVPVLPLVLARCRTLFDLDCNPQEVAQRLESLNGYSAGTRLPGCFDPFEMSVRAVLGQQITVKAARTLARRMAETFGEPLFTPFAGLTRVFPSYRLVAALESPPEQRIEDRLGPLGITGARARSILALAAAMAAGEITLSRHADPEQEMRRLLGLPGFGPWTVEYIAMRALAWPDAFPHTDYGVKKALAGLGPKEIIKAAEAWRPWRSYATIGLWSSLAKEAEKGA